ncbi:phosphate signaling complex protein PhoU [Candidatus Endomicrobiellum devescovinae]|jgi:phosphate transport system protein|uniref:phosphate signaling complex protein PhoU n=1 Tax=Candidatus Endomicrobiellum devescovinae TaxID=3242322 RepID=UPI0028228854|nr:phosphate signaling complex protein PhoU [Endomicrobium sp.]
MRHFDVEMSDLQNQLLDMAGLVQKMIQAATEELVSRDPNQIDTVLSLEEEVNIQEIIIDDKCLKLIALNQPVGADLRFITSAMRINSDLERMGDESLNIAKMSLDLIKYPEIKPLVNIPKMIEIVQNMIIDCIKAFNTSDSELAMSVLSKDNEVDALRDAIISELKTVLIACPDSDTVQRDTDLMFIAKSIERLGDHATNICEDIIFMVHGKDIRHPRA